MKTKLALSTAVVLFYSSTEGTAALVALTTGTYRENFNLISTAAAPGWDVRTAATASSLGTVSSAALFSASWTDTAGAFKNYASASTTSPFASTSQQSSAANRALGIRQTAGFGDPGAAFNFAFSTVGVEVESITIDLQMLATQSRSTIWSLQYGLGVAPGSFTALGTYSDPGSFGSTTMTFLSDSIGGALNNQTAAWFRIVALNAATGDGTRDSFAIDNFAITTAIPEPNTMTLLVSLSLTGLLWRRR